MAYGSLFDDVVTGVKLTGKAVSGITKMAMKAQENKQTGEYQEHKENLTRMLGNAGEKIRGAASEVSQRISESDTYNNLRSSVDSRIQQSKASVVCASCGTKLRSIAKFCDQCGTPVVKVSADSVAEDFDFLESQPAKQEAKGFEPEDFDFLESQPLKQTVPAFAPEEFDFLNDAPAPESNGFQPEDFDFLED